MEMRAWLIALILGGTLIGAIVGPFVIGKIGDALRRQLNQISPQTLLATIIGLFIALIVSALMVSPLSMLPEPYRSLLPIGLTIFLGYVGIWIMIMRGKEFLQIFGVYSLDSPRASRRWSRFGGQAIVDTSAIIDGRIADIGQVGFIPGALIIPRFVLKELQQIADSGDSLRRRRGRRGLEMLAKLQKEPGVPLQISDVDYEDVDGVDAKLVRLGKTLRSPIITNDFSLNRVAELEGVTVLSINELATAVKPIVLPGEEIEIRIVQEGKEAGQGVGFLDDGTMVVIDGGKRLINVQTPVVITRVLQTAVGRMIFAQLKNGTQYEKIDRG
jgi:uncharacterized protein YacL